MLWAGFLICIENMGWRNSKFGGGSLSQWEHEGLLRKNEGTRYEAPGDPWVKN